MMSNITIITTISIIIISSNNIIIIIMREVKPECKGVGFFSAVQTVYWCCVPKVGIIFIP